jgi:hypothetical protein
MLLQRKGNVRAKARELDARLEPPTAPIGNPLARQ